MLYFFLSKCTSGIFFLAKTNLRGFQFQLKMENLRQEAAKVRQRYNTLRQQQMTFVAALDNTRTDAYEKSKPLKSIAEVCQSILFLLVY